MPVELPPGWRDVTTDVGLEERLSAQLREECGDNHVLAKREFMCAARCEGCDSTLFELDGGGWAVVHLTWAGPQSKADSPWVEALGSWDDVLPVIDGHSSGLH